MKKVVVCRHADCDLHRLVQDGVYELTFPDSFCERYKDVITIVYRMLQSISEGGVNNIYMLNPRAIHLLHKDWLELHFNSLKALYENKEITFKTAVRFLGEFNISNGWSVKDDVEPCIGYEKFNTKVGGWV